MRTRRAGVAVALFVLARVAPADARTRQRGPEDPVARALAFFQEGASDGGAVMMRRLRPVPLSPAARAAVVASLPRDGELAPTVAESARIAALRPVLELAQRDGLVLVKVIDVGHAFVGLHARTVLLLSRDALGIVNDEELEALAAHELAHESFWNDYAEARERGDDPRLQELELLCDGLAVAALRQLGRGPETLISAVTKVTRYNEALGATVTAGRYVSLKQRRQYIQDVAAILDGRGQAILSRFVPQP